MDTLRADALGPHGGTASVTPQMDGIAAAGTTFLHARAAAPWTIPSISSLLTARWPSEHGEGAQRVPGAPAAVPTLAETLAAAGWSTAAFVEADWPLLRRGFTTFETPVGDFHTRLAHPDRDGAALTFGRAIAWLGAAPAEPFLLLVHTYEVHDYFVGKAYQRAAATRRHPEYRGRFRSWTFQDASADVGRGVVEDLLAADAADTAFVEALYAAGVEAVDRQVGLLDAALAARGLRDRTLVVLVADHGEGFRPDLRRVHHGGRLHDDLLAVPLVMRWPGRLPSRREARRVTTLDVMPTVLALAGVPVPPGLRGEALFAPPRGSGARGVRVRRRPAVAEESTFLVDASGRRALSSARQAALFAGGLKLIRSPAGPELYDLRDDPGETANLAGARPGAVGTMTARLGTLLPQLDAPGGAPRPEVTEQLRALGYVE